MRWMTWIGLLAATGCVTQEATPPQPAAASAAQEQTPAAAQRPTITVPAGTRIPVKLTYSVWSKTARPGDAVHAVIVFPVTVDTTVAIPEGTYVEGVIDQVSKRASPNHPALQMHFTHLLFANGYTVSLQGATSEAMAEENGTTLSAAGLEGDSAQKEPSPRSLIPMGYLFAAQQPPVLTQPSMPGPSVGEMVGIGVGATVAFVVTMVLLGHHHNTGYTLLDAGTQIEILLQNPLTLDADQVAAAVATPNAQ